MEERELEELVEAAYDVLLNVPPAHPNAMCHVGITTMGRCRRCRQVARLTLAVAKEGYIPPESYFGGVTNGKRWRIKRWAVR